MSKHGVRRRIVGQGAIGVAIDAVRNQMHRPVTASLVIIALLIRDRKQDVGTRAGLPLGSAQQRRLSAKVPTRQPGAALSRAVGDKRIDVVKV